MNIEAQPLGNEYRFDGQESDIVEVFDSVSGLRIIVSTWTDSINEALVEVYFRRVQTYRYLDEGDLIAYWKTEKFRSPHHVYQIAREVGLRAKLWNPAFSKLRKASRCGNGSSAPQMVA
jgi:hypothetical protein